MTLSEINTSPILSFVAVEQGSSHSSDEAEDGEEGRKEEKTGGSVEGKTAPSSVASAVSAIPRGVRVTVDQRMPLDAFLTQTVRPLYKQGTLRVESVFVVLFPDCFGVCFSSYTLTSLQART